MKPRKDRGSSFRKRKPLEPPFPGAAGPADPTSSNSAPSSTPSPTFPPPPRRDPGSTDWGEVADWYDQLVGDAGSDYHQKVVLPGVIRLMAPGPADRCLDVACGQGVLCRMLHHKHGVKMTGIDASGQLIRLAQERSEEAITYDVADARDLSRFEPGSFTAAACVLAIQNIDPIDVVFENVARILAPGGRLVIAMMHPCFRSPKGAYWGWDGERSIQFRRVERYLSPRKEPIRMHPGSDPGLHTWTFHRPLQTYIKALGKAGLLVDALEEWPSHRRSEPGSRALAEDMARREIPLFLALRAVQCGRPASSM